MITFDRVSFQYPNSSHPALSDINLTIAPGTLTLLVGASGSGKSTLLRCINGLVPHFSGGNIIGQITVFNIDPIDAGLEKMATKVGFVFQEPEAQFVYDNVEDEIAFALENMGLSRDDMHKRVQTTIHQLGLTEYQHRALSDLSGGEKQKVAIASALVCQPEVLILDEPTSQLDPSTADDILQYISSLKNSLNLTVILSEHRLERLLPYTDTMIYLTLDQKCFFGRPRDILAQMKEVPPIISIGMQLKLRPLPLSLDEFPKQITPSNQINLENQETTNNEEILNLSNFSVTLDSKEIIKHINFTLKKGEIKVLLGPNGAGKTTLLRAIMGLIPSTGKMHLFGKDFSKKNLSILIKHMAYLPQNPGDLLFAETVLEELKITLNNHRIEKSESDLISFLDQLGLAEKQHEYPRDLSVGERQRIALAAITIHDPEILLLDEPTRGLDYKTKKALGILLKRWCDRGKTILIVSHDIEFCATIADTVTILEAGRIKFSGKPGVAFSSIPGYQTQTSIIFPDSYWITPEQIFSERIIEQQ